MKKLIAALLLIAMLIQALPFKALATVGKVLSKEELARAYALTGLGTGGLKANSTGASVGVAWMPTRMRMASGIPWERSFRRICV